MRDPVPPPEKAQAKVAWENDVPNREPTHQDLEQKTRDTVEKLVKDKPELGSINVNSGKRDGETGPHGEGRAVDINYVNGAHVKDVMLGNDPVAKEQLRQQSAAVEAWGRQNKDVEMVVTPFGGFFRYPGGNGEDMRDATSAEIAAHWNHIHIQNTKGTPGLRGLPRRPLLEVLMRCVSFALALVFLSLSTAQAAESVFEWDEPSKAIVCFGSHTRMDENVRISTAPERDAFGAMRMRLYVGYVQDPDAMGKAQAFYSGPLAGSWESPRLPPGAEKIRVAKRPLRYWVSKIDQGPDGRMQNATAEIDLEAKPPVLRTIERQPGKPPREVLVPLEPQPLTPSARLLIRSFPSPVMQTKALTMRPLSVKAEGTYKHGPELVTPNPWSPEFFAIATRDGSRCVIQALPKAGFWGLEKVLALPAQDDVKGTFLVEMMEDYLPPDAKGPNDLYHRRVHVRVGLDHISTQVLEDHLQYDAEEGVYYKHPRRTKP